MNTKWYMIISGSIITAEYVITTWEMLPEDMLQVEGDMVIAGFNLLDIPIVMYRGYDFCRESFMHFFYLKSMNEMWR